MVVSSYKVTKLNGSIISKELIATDTYNSLNELIFYPLTTEKKNIIIIDV